MSISYSIYAGQNCGTLLVSFIFNTMWTTVISWSFLPKQTPKPFIHSLTPIRRICTNCANRPFRIEKTINTLTFFWFECCTLTDGHFCVFLCKENKILIIRIIINSIKREVRFAIFEIEKFFQGSLSYKNYVIRKAFQCASRISAGRRNSLTWLAASLDFWK